MTLQLQKKHLKRITRCLSKIKLNPANWKIVQLSRRLHMSDKHQKIEISFEHIFRHWFNYTWNLLHEFSRNTIDLISVCLQMYKKYISHIFVIDRLYLWILETSHKLQTIIFIAFETKSFYCPKIPLFNNVLSTFKFNYVHWKLFSCEIFIQNLTSGN